MVVLGLARSAALFLGPTVTTSLNLIINNDHNNLLDVGGSFFGKFALPATLGVLLYIVLLVMIIANWRDPPQDEHAQKSDSISKIAWQFAKQPHSIAFLLSQVLQCCAV